MNSQSDFFGICDRDVALLDSSTRTASCLFLYFSLRLKSQLNCPSAVGEKITQGDPTSLCRTNQLWDDLNTFVALIMIIHSSLGQVCLNGCFWSRWSPLSGYTPNATINRLICERSNEAGHECPLDLSTVPQRHLSSGFDWAPLSRIERSIINHAPKKLRRRFLAKLGLIWVDLILGFPRCLRRIFSPGRDSVESPTFLQIEVQSGDIKQEHHDEQRISTLGGIIID